jgi:predicted site-specific integrase-resolvase
MKLSQYARHAGVRYETAWRWFKAGYLTGYQTATGTIIITETPAPPPVAQRVAIYARVSSAEHRENLERQTQRLNDYCAAKGYPVARTVREIASGVNDRRPKLLALLNDPTITIIVVEHKDRLTRFGFTYLDTLLRQQGRQIEVINPSEDEQADLLADMTSIIYSFAARLYGKRRAKRKTERLMADLQAPTEA